MSCHCFCWIHMARFVEPFLSVRTVGANGQRCERDIASQSCWDFLKYLRTVRSISAEEKGSLGRVYTPCRPQALVSVESSPRAPVLAGDASDGDGAAACSRCVSHHGTLRPIHFQNWISDTAIFHPLLHTERNAKYHIRMFGR